MVTAEPARPMRADARRNYERIVAVAKEAFTADGVDVPADDIAKRAGVGAGTLYRHFPTRDKLIEAVYRDEIDGLAQQAYDLLDELPPGKALETWLATHVIYVVEKHGLAMTLKASVDAGSEVFGWCQSRLRAAADTIVKAAQDEGVLRSDVTGVDILRLGHGLGSAASKASEEDTKRLLTIVLDGLRTQ
ncbi:TetR/AcrR family transcriptional regulator [Amycolatopsis sp. WAC 01375]|uniref:TetR/AcrR family transcriptional regulator n=1 Tax=Amycolatopsis sp. WAC 01375 TaxID=2203194 RepID=UPI000F768DAF|nr:TetR/AcrR family transcriptional regulator [Amycolatopsis sp. WAC 01375]RSM78467.1 TetR/AcrR family transcriptional regulator [Amycolatopsis sp. WAC 01375]